MLCKATPASLTTSTPPPVRLISSPTCYSNLGCVVVGVSAAVRQSIDRVAGTTRPPGGRRHLVPPEVRCQVDLPPASGFHLPWPRGASTLLFLGPAPVGKSVPSTEVLCPLCKAERRRNQDVQDRMCWAFQGRKGQLHTSAPSTASQVKGWSMVMVMVMVIENMHFEDTF